MPPKKDQPDQSTSAREVADDQHTNTPNRPSAVVTVGDISNDQPTETAIRNEEPPPSSSRGPPAGTEQNDQPSSSRSRRKKQEEKGGDKTNKRRPETIFDAPPVPRPCAVCGKKFMNYKALFGHMRSHPGREWRGAFPPPVSGPPPLAETLYGIARDIMSSREPPVGSRRLVDIDLNQEPPPPSPVDHEVGAGRFDLNKDAFGESSSSDDNNNNAA